MEFLLNLNYTYFLFSVFLVISWNFRKYGFSIWGTHQEDLEPDPVKSKLRLLRLPSLAFKECMLSMDLNDIINLSLCSKNTTNTIKLFQRSYFKEITDCKIKFTEESGYLKFSTPTSSKAYLFSPERMEDSYSHEPFEVSQKVAMQFLEIFDCREVEVILHGWTVIEEFVTWGNNYEGLIKSVYCLENIGRNTTFDLVNRFENWKRLVLIHGYNEFHFNQTNQSVSIICWDHDEPDSVWKLPHHYVHFSANAFHIRPFVSYLQSWIRSSIPCTELVDITTELYPSNYFNEILFFNILSSVEFEKVDEEWIHPIHGKINSPSYKIQRSDQKKSALLFEFQKDGEPCLGMHIY